MSWQQILAEAPLSSGRNGVSYYEVKSKTVLNQVRSPHLPFELSLNPYLNCEMGCTYCYARDFSRKRNASGSFDRDVYVKSDAATTLRRELRRLEQSGQLGKPLAIGTATDPYQPIERKRRVTRAVLEALADRGGVVVSVTTKSDLVLRDIDVLQELGKTGYVRVNVTITSPDRDLCRSLEPRAPTPRKRLDAVEELNRAGIPAGVFCMPILPDITDRSRDLRLLMCEAKAAGALYFSTRVLELRRGVRPAFFEWLQQERPGLVTRYRRRYADGPNPPEEISRRIEQMVNSLRAQYHLSADLAFPKARLPRQAQLELFDSPAPKCERSEIANPQSIGKRLPVTKTSTADAA